MDVSIDLKRAEVLSTGKPVLKLKSPRLVRESHQAQVLKFEHL